MQITKIQISIWEKEDTLKCFSSPEYVLGTSPFLMLPFLILKSQGHWDRKNFWFSLLWQGDGLIVSENPPTFTGTFSMRETDWEEQLISLRSWLLVLFNLFHGSVVEPLQILQISSGQLNFGHLFMLDTRQDFHVPPLYFIISFHLSALQNPNFQIYPSEYNFS